MSKSSVSAFEVSAFREPEKCAFCGKHQIMQTPHGQWGGRYDIHLPLKVVENSHPFGIWGVSTKEMDMLQ